MGLIPTTFTQLQPRYIMNTSLEIQLLVPAAHVIPCFQGSTPERLSAFPAASLRRQHRSYRVVLHRSVYCPSHECSNFYLTNIRCCDFSVDGSRLPQRHHCLRAAPLPGYPPKFSLRTPSHLGRLSYLSAPSLIKSISRCLLFTLLS